MPFHTLRSVPATLVAFMLMCATPASSSSAPCSDPDPNRGGGLPPCECDVYHNGAFQCMSRMCSKPWGDIQVCYPTRVGHPGTVLDGRFYDNNCDDGQSMCSPWTPPTPATTPPPSAPPYRFNDTTIRDAVQEYLADAASAEAIYGPISGWDTSSVTNMAVRAMALADICIHPGAHLVSPTALIRSAF